MIKLVSCAHHSNIGDYYGSLRLASLIEVLTGRKVELSGYQIPMTDEFIKKISYDADAIVIGNGGGMGHINGKYHLFTPEDKRLRNSFNMPILIWSTGYNYSYALVADEEYYDNLRWLLNRADLIGVRTPDDVKYSNKTVDGCAWLCPDPLLFVGDTKSEFVDKKVGLCLHAHHATSWGYNQQDIIDMVNDYTDDIVMLDHDVAKGHFPLVGYLDVDFVVTDRFHGCVAAAAFGKPFYAIDFNVKLRGMINMMNIKNSGQIPNIKANFADFLFAKEEIRSSIIGLVELYRQDYIDFAMGAAGIINQ